MAKRTSLENFIKVLDSVLVLADGHGPMESRFSAIISGMGLPIAERLALAVEIERLVESSASDGDLRRLWRKNADRIDFGSSRMIRPWFSMIVAALKQAD